LLEERAEGLLRRLPNPPLLISDATVFVEAGEKSGSLHQGWEALRLGRPLFLCESVLADPGLSWPKEMEHCGAQIWSLSSLDLILEVLPERSGEAATPLAF
jgi:DNA processing protein